WLTFTLLLTSSLFGQLDFGGASASNSTPAFGVMGRTHSALISGRVQQLDGTPVKDARIEVVSRASGQTVTSAFTDAGGTFHLAEIPAGNYDSVAQSGVNEARGEIVVDGLERYVSPHLAAHGYEAETSNPE